MIDFGHCRLLNDDIYNQIVELYNNSNFYELFNTIKNFAGSIFRDQLRNIIEFMYYVMKIPNLNNKMSNLIKKRNNMINLCLKDKHYVKLSQKVSIININWTFSLFKNIISNDKLLLELLDDAELSSSISTLIGESRTLLNRIKRKVIRLDHQNHQEYSQINTGEIILRIDKLVGDKIKLIEDKINLIEDNEQIIQNVQNVTNITREALIEKNKNIILIIFFLKCILIMLNLYLGNQSIRHNH
jgi:hypothetical protein